MYPLVPVPVSQEFFQGDIIPFHIYSCISEMAEWVPAGVLLSRKQDRPDLVHCLGCLGPLFPPLFCDKPLIFFKSLNITELVKEATVILPLEDHRSTSLNDVL